MNQKNPHAVALGSKKSSRKALTSKENGSDNMRPHIQKIKHFEKVYPHPLEENEWKYKFELNTLTPSGKRKSTYNPDYFCPTTGFYIEVVTSIPNISEQGARWEEALKLGLKLKIYWWEGEEITHRFTHNEKITTKN